MKKSLRFSILIALVLSCGLAVSCDRRDPEEPQRYNTEIANYLYGIEYDDYDFDACKKYFDDKFINSGAACSEVRRGNFIGRNLDWYINKNASAIIKMNHNDKHYASIGIVGCHSDFTNDLAKSGKYDDVYKYLPFKTEDGINEHGLYVGINVMPTGETSFDKSTWKTGEYGHSAAHTNPSAEMTCAVNYLPRILLDNAKNVEEAKEIIASINWTDPVNYPHKDETQSFHWLICDPTHSVVLEFIDNKAHYTEAESVTEPGFGTIMTNFTNCLWKAGIMQTSGIGYERYDVLKAGYKDYAKYPDSMEGMQELMKQAWFTKTYTTSVDSKDYWLTENACEDIPAEDLYQKYELAQDPTMRAVFLAKTVLFYELSLWYVEDTPLWFSTHTSVYDISERKLHVMVHEGLDGMRDFYEASLSSSFVKPLR